MSTSHYFQNFNLTGEQRLIEDLVLESIKIYGYDVYYCPRTLIAKNEIYGEDALSEYKRAYFIDMYIRSFDSYEGDGQFLTKFNLEIRDQLTFTVSLRNFANEIGINEPRLIRPMEGDLIYFPMAGRLLIIKYVNQVPVFYQMGAIQMYDLVTEMFEYGNERLRTGIESIDIIEQQNSTNMSTYRIVSQDNKVIVDQDGFDLIQQGFDLDQQSHDVFADNEEIQTASDGIVDFSEIDPFSEGVI